MVETINLIIFLSSIIGIIAVVLGLDISRKVVGELKTMLILFILTTSIFTLGEIFKLIIILLDTDIYYPQEIVNMVLAGFLLITMFTIKHVIEHLGKIRQRERKK